MIVNDDKCLSSDTSTCSFTAILSFHHFIHLHRFHLVQLILRGHEECSCISPFQSAILEAATGSSTKNRGYQKMKVPFIKFHPLVVLILCFNPFLISTWCFDVLQSVFFWSNVRCKIEHHTSIFGFCAAASPKCPYKKKVQRFYTHKQHRSFFSKLPVTMKNPNVFGSIFDKKWVDESRTAKLRDANTDALGRTAGLNGTLNHQCQSYL